MGFLILEINLLLLYLLLYAQELWTMKYDGRNPKAFQFCDSIKME